MVFKRKLYNIIIVAMIILISAVIIFSATELANPEVSQPSDAVAEDSLLPENAPITENENVVIQGATSANYLPKAPSFSKAEAAIAYANKILNNYSFSSVMTQSSVNDPVLNMKVTQNVSQQKYKTKDECLLINVGTCSDSEGMNYYRYTYMNEADNIVKRRTTTSNTAGNFSNEPIKTWTVSEFENTNGGLPYQLYYVLNANTVDYSGFSISGKDYVIKLSVKPEAANAFAGFEKFIMNSPAEVKDFNGISANFEIRINRKTGAYSSIKLVERYSVCKNTNSFGWQSATITQTSTEFFTFADINISSLVKSVVK